MIINPHGDRRGLIFGGLGLTLVGLLLIRQARVRAERTLGQR